MLTDLLRPVVPTQVRRWLRQWDRDRRLTRGVKRLRQHDTFIPLSVETLDDLLYGWNNPWSLRQELICQLWDDAWHTRGPILECGSGLSTILLAAVAEKRRKEVIVLEHDFRWHQRMTRVLETFGLMTVRLVHAPLVESATYSWYDVPSDLPAGITLVICDGPPGETRGGRYGLLPRMGRHLSPDCVILVDDAARPGEQAVLERWAEEFSIRRREAGVVKPYEVVEGPVAR
jgi:predicted O-methyltransferase YrrM